MANNFSLPRTSSYIMKAKKMAPNGRIRRAKKASLCFLQGIFLLGEKKVKCTYWRSQFSPLLLINGIWLFKRHFRKIISCAEFLFSHIDFWPGASLRFREVSTNFQNLLTCSARSEDYFYLSLVTFRAFNLTKMGKTELFVAWLRKASNLFVYLFCQYKTLLSDRRGRICLFNGDFLQKQI